MTPAVLRTERLCLRPLQPADAPALHVALSDADALAYWSDPPSRTLEESNRHVDRMLAAPGACWWAIADGDDGDDDDGPAVGYVGYVGRATAGARAGLGYILRRDRWGRGLATEAATAALRYGFDVLGIDRVELWIHPANVASQRVASKLGATVRGEFLAIFPDVGATPMTVFGVRRDDALAPGALAPPVPSPDRRVLAADPVLGVDDVGAALDFYRDRLGFEVEFVWGRPPEHAGLVLGQWTVPAASIQLTRAGGRGGRGGRGARGARGGDAGRGGWRARGRGRRLGGATGWTYVRVGGAIEERYAAHRAAGVEITEPLATQPWGMREYAVRDPWGNVLRFATPA